MGRHLASASQRGYGQAHKQARLEYLARHQPGDPCSRCGEPMNDPPDLLDLDHTDDRTGYLGLAHRSCNRSSAGRLYAERVKVCDGCGLTFSCRSRDRRYCSVECYDQHRPRREPMPKVSKIYFRACEVCDSIFATRRSNTKRCSDHRGYIRATPPLVPCQVCGTPMESATRPPKYCSRRCRRQSPAAKAYRQSDAYRARRKAQKRRARARRQEGEGTSNLYHRGPVDRRSPAFSLRNGEA